MFASRIPVPNRPHAIVESPHGGEAGYGRGERLRDAASKVRVSTPLHLRCPDERAQGGTGRAAATGAASS